MKIISWNVNGLRAVERKGALRELLQTHNPDVLLLQETKAKPEQLSRELTDHPEYEQYYNSAEKPGYAGTAVWIRKGIAKTVNFSSGMPNFEDLEGRIVRVDISSPLAKGGTEERFSILGVYFPNGGKSPEAWEGKLKFYDQFLAYVNQLRDEGKTVIWAGDVNCAHAEIDLARPRENDGKIGFHPSERAWIDRVVADGWVDVYRSLNPDGVVYSWWDVITRARERNVGWRIDYFFVDAGFLSQVKKVEYLTGQMGSDHCPVMLEV